MIPSYALVMILVTVSAYATAGEDIPWSYQKVATEYGLSPALLYAAALTASGRSLIGRGVRPWPWTLGITGRPTTMPRGAPRIGRCKPISHATSMSASD